MVMYVYMYVNLRERIDSIHIIITFKVISHSAAAVPLPLAVTVTSRQRPRLSRYLGSSSNGYLPASHPAAVATTLSICLCRERGAVPVASRPLLLREVTGTASVLHLHRQRERHGHCWMAARE